MCPSSDTLSQLSIKREDLRTCCIEHHSQLQQILTFRFEVYLQRTTVMTPVLLFVLFISLSAIPPGATDNGEKQSLDASDIIERANANITTRLVDGDIVQSLARNAVACTARGCKWPKRRYVYVPIYISRRYTRSERNIIIRALLTFHTSTCIRFVWRRSHRNYLHFFSGSGCWSYLGRQSRGQAISLRKNGCLYTSTVQHEVLHALGFAHEQVRSDRDSYVSILTQNIKPGQKHNFLKRQTNNFGTPYDFNSVMHYSKYAFSKNGQPTILAKSNPSRNFGNARTMSNIDIALVNRLYQC
ncbi:low choriolytic enzyme-like isoform X2 [Trematomus bernacchii]|uniref:low choriolytic enzyme-like isoform X2 n=1 Tax=Trematomus bernacchii TaxID=40690 RepID=UPI00146DB420|nr:low choriolytic enzyme-like isoform X2 [Trematomus bernacchii]